jgi:hypothetical protein
LAKKTVTRSRKKMKSADFTVTFTNGVYYQIEVILGSIDDCIE